MSNNKKNPQLSNLTNKPDTVTEKVSVEKKKVLNKKNVHCTYNKKS